MKIEFLVISTTKISTFGSSTRSLSLPAWVWVGEVRYRGRSRPVSSVAIKRSFLVYCRSLQFVPLKHSRFLWITSSRFKMSVTTTCLEKTDTVHDRLAPVSEPAKQMFPPGGRMLLRSSSFNMLRQFPAYLCSRDSKKDIVHWLYDSRTKISAAIGIWHKEAKKTLLILSVWSCLLLLVAQVAWVGMYLATATIPWGLGFLMSCLAVTGTIAAHTVRPTKKHKSQEKR